MKEFAALLVLLRKWGVVLIGRPTSLLPFPTMSAILFRKIKIVYVIYASWKCEFNVATKCSFTLRRVFVSFQSLSFAYKFCPQKFEPFFVSDGTVIYKSLLDRKVIEKEGLSRSLSIPSLIPTVNKECLICSFVIEFDLAADQHNYPAFV